MTSTSSAGPDAANNYRSGPFATAIQWLLFLPMLACLLPIGLLLNLFAWARTYAVDGGVYRTAFRKTLPTNSAYRKLSSIVKVLNAVELEERTLNPARFEEVFWGYCDKNGFARDEMGFEARAIAVDRSKVSVYRELTAEDPPFQVKITLMHSPRHAVICGLYDFGYMDGTSCLNFIQALLADYFDEAHTENRPREGGAVDITLAESVRPRLGAAYALGVALRESWNFAVGWARWGFSREAYDAFFPPEISVAIETIDAEDHSAMVQALSSRPEPIKPFEHFMATSARVAQAAGLPEKVLLLTQISCQARYYEPPLPRNLVGYWLIGRSTWHTLSEMQTVAFARAYYTSLKTELAELSGEVRNSLVRQAMLNVGGTGLASNLRQVLWFNNYGLREMTPSAGRLSYHWAPNYKLCTGILVNIVTINGRTCITLSSSVLPQAGVEQAATHLKRLLLETARELPR